MPQPSEMPSVTSDAETGCSYSGDEMPSVTSDAETGCSYSGDEMPSVTSDAETGCSYSGDEMPSVTSDAETGCSYSGDEMPSVTSDAETGCSYSGDEMPSVTSDAETGCSYSGDDEESKLSKIPVRKRKRCKKKSAKPLLRLVLSPKERKEEIDIKLCIICQKRTPKSPISSTKGRSTILKCANESRGIVYDRINVKKSSRHFCLSYRK